RILSFPLIFLFTPPPPSAIYPLSLHDALPICPLGEVTRLARRPRRCASGLCPLPLPPIGSPSFTSPATGRACPAAHSRGSSCSRSEEHTSELQSPCNLVCRLLLEKKKKIT